MKTLKTQSSKFITQAIRATELTREYGIHIQSIYKWLEKRQKVKIADETVSAEEIIKLKKEIARLKEENEILKKATAIFAKRN